VLPNGTYGTRSARSWQRLVFGRADGAGGVPERAVPCVIQGIEGFFQEVPGIAVSCRFLAKQTGKTGKALKRTHEELAGRLKGEEHPHIDESRWKERRRNTQYS
jgi:hypothetical protein